MIGNWLSTDTRDRLATNDGSSIGYTGALWDPQVQMSLMRRRWHDPHAGRWITRDPAGYVDGMSLYLYARGNPLFYLDPTGLTAVADYLADCKMGAAAAADWLGAFGTRLGENALGQIEGMHDMAGEFGLAMAHRFGAVDDETFLSESKIIKNLGAAIEDKGVGGVAADAAAGVANAVAGTAIGVVDGDPAAAADAVMAAIELGLGAKGLGSFRSMAAITDDAAGAVTKAVRKTPAAVPDGRFYSTAMETKLKPTSYPGSSRAAHFQEANESLLRAMEGNAEVAARMRGLGINVERTTAGLAPRQSPAGWTWHHAPEPGVMQLVPRAQHAPGSIFQPTLHPGGRGGMAMWGE